MVTPLQGRDELDVPGLERLIERILGGGVHGLFILGTTGEAPSLSYRLRRELIERVCRQVKNRVPVLVGITDTSFVESVNLAGFAADAGVSAAVMAPPYYFPAGQPELVEYIQRIAAVLPLPLFLYNIPQMTKLDFDPDTVRRVLDLERLIGMKDSSGNLDYFREILSIARGRPDWSVLVGPENLLGETVLLGGDGGVNGGANLHPRLFVEMYEASVEGDRPRMVVLQEQIVRLGRIYQVGRHPSAFLKGTKCALSVLGVCDDFMADPFHCFQEMERQKIRALLAEIPLLT